MRFCQLFAVSLCLLVGLVIAQDDKPLDDARNVAPRDEEHHTTSQIVVYPAANSPASHLAELLPGVLDEDSVRVTADPMSNLLLIRVSKDSQDRVLALLKELDRVPRTVIVDAYLLKLKGQPLSDEEAASLSGASAGVAKKIAELQAGNRLAVGHHIELAALENQPSMLQVGGDVSVASGVANVGSGRRMTSYRTLSVGTILTVTARTTPDNAIALSLDFELSDVEPAEPEDNDDEEIGPQRPPSVTRLTHQSTLQLDNGHARLSGALAGGKESDSRHVYFVVSARIAADPDKRVASVKKFSRPPGTGFRPAPQTTNRAATRPKNLDGRYLAYFTQVVRKYDKNEDGKLNAEEWSQMNRDPSDADRDGDGFLTPQELTDWGRER